MSTTFGNSHQQLEFQTFLKGTNRTVALTGPAHLGKASFARYAIEQSVDPSDFLLMEEGIDGVRGVVEFCRSLPLNSEYRVVLVDNASSLSEPAQDALLKLTEEPHQSLKIVLISHDLGHLQLSLRSRIRKSTVWYHLNDSDMRLFANSFSSVACEPLLSLSCGIPGLYRIMMETPGFEEFFSFTNRIALGEVKPFNTATPSLIKELKGPSAIRDAIVHVIHRSSRISRDPMASAHMLRFCDTLSRVTSANADIHWSRMAAHLSDVI